MIQAFSAATPLLVSQSSSGDSGSNGLTIGEVVAIVVCSAILAVFCAVGFIFGRMHGWCQCCCCCILCACCRRRRSKEEEEEELKHQYAARGQGLVVVADPSVMAKRVAGFPNATLAPPVVSVSAGVQTLAPQRTPGSVV